MRLSGGFSFFPGSQHQLPARLSWCEEKQYLRVDGLQNWVSQTSVHTGNLLSLLFGFLCHLDLAWVICSTVWCDIRRLTPSLQSVFYFGSALFVSVPVLLVLNCLKTWKSSKACQNFLDSISLNSMAYLHTF